MGALVLMRMVGRSGVKISILDVLAKEPGETYMVSIALATLDLVTHDDARPASPAMHLGGHAVLSCGELAGLAGQSERVLRRDGKALVLRAGGRDLPVLSALGLTVAVRAPATLGVWPARCANCPAGQR